MELPPDKAEFLKFKAEYLQNTLEKIIPRNPFQLKFNNALKIADKALGSAKIYLQTSLERSKHMVEKSLEKMEELNHDRGILVIGGFHTRGALRYLSEHRNVSWSVFLPKFTMR